MGRPQKPHKTSWGEIVPGLSRRSDGRWRIVASGEHYTEHDEYRAVARFKAKNQTKQTLWIPIHRGTPAENAAFGDMLNISDDQVLEIDEFTDEMGQVVDETALWEYVRRELLERPDYVAQKTRIPQLATFASLALPKDAIRIENIISTYKDHSAAKLAQSIKVAVKAMDRLVGQTKAVTLDDLTTERLIDFRDSVENDKTLTTGGSKSGIFRKIKTVIGFGLKRGMDAGQIRGCLDRCKVLWTGTPESQVNPHPISRSNLHLLLDAAVGKDAEWKAWMLVALNCALKFGDCVNMRWDMLNLEKKTYCTIRKKTESKSIPQAAVLWDVTIAAIKGLRRHDSPFVFTSRNGTLYNRNGRGNDFAKFRTKVEAVRGLEDKDIGSDVCFDDFRDGAYTAACLAGCDNRLCRLMAGHKAEGLQDNYVLRSPEMVKPATEAVHKHYFG